MGNGKDHDSASGSVTVVGVDGSATSMRALDLAVDDARAQGGTVRIVTAWHYPYAAAGAVVAPTVPVTDFEQAAQEILDQAVAAARARWAEVPLETRLVEGPAVRVVLEACKGADRLVMGSRGHGRMTGLFLGSVSQYLCAHAPCPVTVVHGPVPGDGSRAPAPVPETQPAPPEVVAGAAAEANRLETIPEEECLALLASRAYGRVAVVRDGRPEIFPVNFALDGRTVAFRTGPGTKLEWSTLGPLAFEVEEIDEASRTGWVVEVRGVGRDITEAVDEWSTRIRARPLTPWAEGERSHWIAIAEPSVSGRRLVHR